MSNIRSPESPPRHRSFLPLLQRLRGYTMHLLPASIQSYRVAPIALLIDGDNTSANSIAAILVEAGKYGGVTIRRVYANWASSATKPWQEVASFYNLKQVHHGQTVAGKNAADIALVVDAMDLFYRDGIRHFCLVASDSDYTPLVRRLREAGCIVLVIGEARISQVLQQAATAFVPTERLTPSSTKVALSPTPIIPDTPLPSTPSSSLPSSDPPQNDMLALDDLLKRAYLQEANEKENEWVDVPRFFVVLQKHHPSFNTKDYGYKDLPALIKSRTYLFETRKQTGQAKHLEVRLLVPHK